MDLSLLEFSIDFEGQKLVDSIISILSYISIPISFLIGFSTGSVVNLVISFASFIILSWLIVLPAWPTYNQNPSNWQQVKYEL